MATKPIPLEHLTAPRRVARWQETNGTFLAGRAIVDEVDSLASEMDRKWGVDRLRLLVAPEWREKFDRQRVLWNRAIQNGELEDLRREGPRTVNAWRKLDELAVAVDARPIEPETWEVALEDGSVAVICRTLPEAFAAAHDGRKAAVYTLEEIGRLLSAYPAIARIKETWPGATVVAARSPDDPLNQITDEELNDALPF